MELNCQRLECSLGRPIRFCNSQCHRRKPIVGFSGVNDLVKKLTAENEELKKLVAELTKPEEPKNEPEDITAEDKPKRKYNRK